jgi:hypothetical protein
LSQLEQACRPLLGVSAEHSGGLAFKLRIVTVAPIVGPSKPALPQARAGGIFGKIEPRRCTPPSRMDDAVSRSDSAPEFSTKTVFGGLQIAPRTAKKGIVVISKTRPKMTAVCCH